MFHGQGEVSLVSLVFVYQRLGVLQTETASIGNNLHWRAGEARDYRIVDGLGCPPENDLLDFNLSE